MLRQLKRSLREWKQEFLAVWSRLTAFHRIVLGILLSIGVTYAGKIRLIEPLEHRVSDVRQQLEDDSVPARVPVPERDGQTQDALLRVESMEPMLSRLAGKVRQAEQATDLQLSATETDANAAMVKLANRFGLAATFQQIPAKGSEPSAEAGFAYEMTGSFEAIFKLLDAAERAPFLWELCGVSIRIDGSERMSPEQLVSAPARLMLRFTLHLQPYNRSETP